ncbi:MAG: adenylate/guanylate cyclase domain-containing protein [Bacteroidota bacterium]
MEQHGEAGRINVSQATFVQINQQFVCTHRGKVEAKNKGAIDMYFVEQPVGAMKTESA